MTNDEIKLDIFSKFASQFFEILPRTIGYFVAGGLFARLYHGLPIRDVDLFAESNAHFKTINQILMDDEHLEYLPEQSHPNLSKFQHQNGFEIDLVNAPKGQQRSATELLTQFDFTISRVYVYIDPFRAFNISSIDQQDFADIAERKLRFTGKVLWGTKKNNTLTRLLKYTKLGYKIKEEDYVAIGETVHGLLQRAIDNGAIDPREIGGNKYY